MSLPKALLKMIYLFPRWDTPRKIKILNPKNGGLEKEFPNLNWVMFDVQNDNFQGVYVSSLEIANKFQQHLGEPKLLHL